MSSEDDRHVHQGTLSLLGEDRLQTEWLMKENRETGHAAKFDLVRRKARRGKR